MQLCKIFKSVRFIQEGSVKGNESPFYPHFREVCPASIITPAYIQVYAVFMMRAFAHGYEYIASENTLDKEYDKWREIPYPLEGRIMGNLKRGS